MVQVGNGPTLHENTNQNQNQNQNPNEVPDQNPPPNGNPQNPPTSFQSLFTQCTNIARSITNATIKLVTF